MAPIISIGSHRDQTPTGIPTTQGPVDLRPGATIRLTWGALVAIVVAVFGAAGVWFALERRVALHEADTESHPIKAAELRRWMGDINGALTSINSAVLELKDDQRARPSIENCHVVGGRRLVCRLDDR